MATNIYSLADTILTIKLPENSELLEKSGITVRQFSIGGPGENGLNGSFVGNIIVKRSASVWSTDGDATGSWVHNKSLNRTGTVSVDIKQVSDDIIKLSMICNAYESIQEGIPGLTIVLSSATNSNNQLAVCSDCLITKVPDHKFGDRATDFPFEFTCGRVMFY